MIIITTWMHLFLLCLLLLVECFHSCNISSYDWTWACCVHSGVVVWLPQTPEDYLSSARAAGGRRTS